MDAVSHIRIRIEAALRRIGITARENKQSVLIGFISDPGCERVDGCRPANRDDAGWRDPDTGKCYVRISNVAEASISVYIATMDMTTTDTTIMARPSRRQPVRAPRRL